MTMDTRDAGNYDQLTSGLRSCEQLFVPNKRGERDVYHRQQPANSCTLFTQHTPVATGRVFVLGGSGLPFS